MPTLSSWVYQYETPEAQPGFDDSSWTAASKTSSNSSTPIPPGQPDLFADDYGFHHGDVWYRGTYSGASAATSVNISYRAGGVGMIEAWLDGTFLGSNRLPTPGIYSTSPAESATATFTFSAALQTDGTHELSVVVRMMGHSEDGNSNNANKAARGLTAVTLTGAPSAPISWKIQGNEGGENITDTVRGPMNNGGLYGERAGWYLPGYPDGNWAPVTLPYSDTQPGVAWYRTTFTLNEPAGADASLGLTINDVATKAYRATIFLNGWNMGQYINNVGPQHTFVLPNGILHTGIGPPAFKGFAASPSVPACGTNWVTRVGGSSSPPAGPLPDYLGVIVSSSVSQTGAAVSGDTTGIVVVKTDPGYGPLPTEHGTGTVVATAR